VIWTSCWCPWVNATTNPATTRPHPPIHPAVPRGVLYSSWRRHCWRASSLRGRPVGVLISRVRRQAAQAQTQPPVQQWSAAQRGYAALAASLGEEAGRPLLCTVCTWSCTALLTLCVGSRRLFGLHARCLKVAPTQPGPCYGQTCGLLPRPDHYSHGGQRFAASSAYFAGQCSGNIACLNPAIQILGLVEVS
jgi:hypothetical protein